MQLLEMENEKLMKFDFFRMCMMHIISLDMQKAFIFMLILHLDEKIKFLYFKNTKGIMLVIFL
jgi:hypothetical protein